VSYLVGIHVSQPLHRYEELPWPLHLSVSTNNGTYHVHRCVKDFTLVAHRMGQNGPPNMFDFLIFKTSTLHTQILLLLLYFRFFASLAYSLKLLNVKMGVQKQRFFIQIAVSNTCRNIFIPETSYLLPMFSPPVCRINRLNNKFPHIFLQPPF